MRFINMSRTSVYQRFGKRLFDILLAAATLIVLSPLLAVSALLIRVTSPGPVLFRQHRLGRAGSVFSLYKFRTMTNHQRLPQETFLDNPEITAVGRWLRRFKIDELPQVFNVLKGEMSVVGPRPALPEHVAAFDAYGRQRLSLRPGLTGLAQVHGNIFLSWPERWRYDSEYARRCSLALDLRLILRTVPVIVRGEQCFLKRPSETSGVR